MSPQMLPLLSRRVAAVQASSLVALFLGFQLLGGALGRGAQAKLEHPLLSVFLSGTVMMLPVVFFSLRDPQWRQSLGLAPGPWLPLLGRGALGVFGAYALNIIASLTFLAASGGIKQTVAGRAELLNKFNEIPTWSIVPLVVFVGLWEETVFRGFLLGRLRAALDTPKRPESRLQRDALAVGLSAAAFAAGHAYQGVLGVLQTLMVGLVFGALTVWSASLWPAIFAHAAIDGFGLFAIKVLKPLLERAAKGQLTL